MSTSIYVSARVKDRPTPAVDSIQEDCSNCGYPVWIDKRTADIKDEADKVMCTHCVSELSGKSMAELIGEFGHKTIAALLRKKK